MSKRLLISFVLSSALCAPYAHAMNRFASLATKAKNIASIAQSAKSAVTAEAGAANRGLSTMPTTKKLISENLGISGSSTQRAISNVAKPNAKKSGLTLVQQGALGVGATGLAYVIDNDAVVHATDGTYLSLFSKVWAAIIGLGSAASILTGEPDVRDITQEFLIKTPSDRLCAMMNTNPEYAEQFAALITQENIVRIDIEVLMGIICHYPEAGPAFITYITSDTTLVKILENSGNYHSVKYPRYRLPLQLVERLLSRNPQSTGLFAKYVADNIVALTKASDGLWFVFDIMKINPQIRTLIEESAANNFATLLDSSISGVSFITIMMRENAELAELFVGLAVNNFATLANTWGCKYFIETIMRDFPQYRRLFEESAITNIASLIATRHGKTFIESMIQANPQWQSALEESAAKNIVAMLDSQEGYFFIKNMVKSSPKYQALVEEQAAKDWTLLLEASHGLNIITCMMEEDARYAALFSERAVKDCAVLAEKDNGLQFLIYLMKGDPDVKKELQTKFNESGNHSDASKSSSLVREIFYKVIRSEDVTPSELGFIYSRDNSKGITQDEIVQKTIKDVIAIEKEYQKTHYTFVHGRNFAYNLREMVYRNLWEYAYNTKAPADFRFTHTKEEHDPLTKNVLVMPEEKKLHERNITVLENYKSEELRNRRLFLNTNLFGNLKVGGSSSFSYFWWNSNASGSVKLSIEDVFGQFGQKELYEKYKERFEALDEEHRALTQYGELLVVAVPKERVEQDVQTIDVHGDSAGIKTLEVLQKRETDPSFRDNELNFTLAMTDTAALDPKSGIKVRSVHAVDPVKYAAWQAKYDALISELEAEFKRNWNRSLKAKEIGHKELLSVVNAVKKHHDAKNK